MATFQLQIVTPDGLLYDGAAEKIILRTDSGDVGILPRHSDYLAPLSIGIARIFTPDGERKAACAGGMVSVTGGKVRVVASTFEWGESIDVLRAEKAKDTAQQRIDSFDAGQYEYKLAQIKLKKALARLGAAEGR